jgi:hypothetical protein
MRVLVVLVAAPLGFVVAVPSSANVGLSWIAKLGSAGGANAAPRVVSMSPSREKVTVRFSERVKAVHRSFGLEWPLGHPKGFTLNGSPAKVVDVPNETPAAAFDRAYGAVGSPWMSAGTRAAIQDYANRASAKASKDRIGRQVMLRTLMLAGPDAQVM